MKFKIKPRQTILTNKTSLYNILYYDLLMQLHIISQKIIITDMHLNISNSDSLLEFSANLSKLPISKLSLLTLNSISLPFFQQLLPIYCFAIYTQSCFILQWTLVFSYCITNLFLISFLSFNAKSLSKILKLYNVIQNKNNQNLTYFSFITKIFLNVILLYIVLHWHCTSILVFLTKDFLSSL